MHPAPNLGEAYAQLSTLNFTRSLSPDSFLGSSPSPQPLSLPLHSTLTKTQNSKKKKKIETPAFADDGTAYLPDQNGVLWKFPPPAGSDNAAAGEVFAYLPGRPLGIVVDRSVADPAVGNGRSLVVAVAGAGLFRVLLATKAVTMLTSYASVSPTGEFPDVPSSAAGRIAFANAVVVSKRTGAIYVTDSTTAVPAPPKRPGDPWDTFSMSLGTLYAGDLSGRLLRFDPATQKTTVVSVG